MDKVKFLDELREAERLTRNGEIEDSLNLSGELLMKASWNCNGPFKSLKEATEAAELLADSGVIHVRALVAAKETGIAVATAASILLKIGRIEMTGDLMKAQAELINNALVSITSYIHENETTPGEEVFDHYKKVIILFLSVLYALYNEILHNYPDSVILPSIYLTIRRFVDEGVPIERPEIDINGIKINPLEPQPVYADIVGRLQAIGFVFE